MDGEKLGVPKMHAVLHTLPAVYFWGAVDNAALALQESDHIPYVKDAVKRTRRHEQTYQDEVLLAASFIDAVEDLMSFERCLPPFYNLWNGLNHYLWYKPYNDEIYGLNHLQWYKLTI